MFVTMKLFKNYIIKISGTKIDSENLNKKMSAKNNPSLAQEWHSTLNIPLTPNNVTSGSEENYSITPWCSPGNHFLIGKIYL